MDSSWIVLYDGNDTLQWPSSVHLAEGQDIVRAQATQQRPLNMMFPCIMSKSARCALPVAAASVH